MLKIQDVRWCGFRWSIPLWIGYVWKWSIDSAILTSSCLYCIWNRCCQNHRSILPHFQLLACFDTVEFNRLPCSINKMYDDAVSQVDSAINWLCLEFEYWYGYLDFFMLILHIDRFCQNLRSILPNFLLFEWFDTVEFNRHPCSNNKMYFDVVFDDLFRCQLTMFEVCILIGLSRLLDTHISYEIAI